MIRFIDMTEEYFGGYDVGTPIWTFLCTSTDRFLENADGQHVFDLDDVREHKQSERLLSLLPKDADQGPQMVEIEPGEGFNIKSDVQWMPRATCSECGREFWTMEGIDHGLCLKCKASETC